MSDIEWNVGRLRDKINLIKFMNSNFLCSFCYSIPDALIIASLAPSLLLAFNVNTDENRTITLSLCLINTRLLAYPDAVAEKSTAAAAGQSLRTAIEIEDRS